MRKVVMALLAALLLVACKNSSTTPPGSAIQWEKTYGIGYDNQGKDIRQTADGGFVIAGLTGSVVADSVGPYLLKTDASGNKLWDKSWPSPDDREFAAVRQTADGGYVCVGYIEPKETAPNQDAYLVRTDASGDTLWTRSYGQDGWFEKGYALQQTSDNGFIIAGSAGTGTGGKDHGAYVIRTDANGDTLWTRIYDPGPEWDEVRSIEPAPSGGWILTGVAASYTGGDDDLWLLRLGDNGDTLWTRTFGGGSGDVGYWAIPASDGGFIAAGQTYSFGAGQTDVWLVKVNDNGDSLWTRTYGGTSYDCGYRIRRCADGGYAVTGYSQSFGVAGSEVYFLKTRP